MSGFAWAFFSVSVLLAFVVGVVVGICGHSAWLQAQTKALMAAAKGAEAPKPISFPRKVKRPDETVH